MKRIFHSYILLLSGIITTGIVGLVVNYCIQNQIISRQEKFEIYKRNLDSAEKTLNGVISLINSRMFSLQRVIWTYRNSEQEDTDRVWKEYRAQLGKWNFYDMSYKTKLDLYFGKNISNEFKSVNNSNSLYTYFWLTHRKILKWKTCLRKACKYSKTRNEVCETRKCNKEMKLSEKSIRALRDSANKYIKKLYLVYRKKYLEDATS